MTFQAHSKDQTESPRKSIRQSHSRVFEHKTRASSVDTLLMRFNQINSEVEVDAQALAFNLLTLGDGEKREKNFGEMGNFHLRKMENRIETQKVQQEIKNRERKRNSKSQFPFKQNAEVIQNYETIYKNFSANKALFDDNDDLSDEQYLETARGNQKGIAYIGQLRKYPVLLNYTINKIKLKEDETGLLDSQKSELKFEQSQKQQNFISVELEGKFQSIADNEKKKKLHQTPKNPEDILDVTYNKFYARNQKGKQKISEQIQTIPRCSKMIRRQSDIVNGMATNNMSKENRRKLNLKMNEIVMSIGKGQKTRTNLPKIPTLQSKKIGLSSTLQLNNLDQ